MLPRCFSINAKNFRFTNAKRIKAESHIMINSLSRQLNIIFRKAKNYNKIKALLTTKWLIRLIFEEKCQNTFKNQKWCASTLSLFQKTWILLKNEQLRNLRKDIIVKVSKMIQRLLNPKFQCVHQTSKDKVNDLFQD